MDEARAADRLVREIPGSDSTELHRSRHLGLRPRLGRHRILQHLLQPRAYNHSRNVSAPRRPRREAEWESRSENFEMDLDPIGQDWATWQAVHRAIRTIISCLLSTWTLVSRPPNLALHLTRPAVCFLGVRSSLMRAGQVSLVVRRRGSWREKSDEIRVRYPTLNSTERLYRRRLADSRGCGRTTVVARDAGSLPGLRGRCGAVPVPIGVANVPLSMPGLSHVAPACVLRELLAGGRR